MFRHDSNPIRDIMTNNFLHDSGIQHEPNTKL
jgi:hypothetical protein